MNDKIYIVWDMKADSWSAARSVMSIHKTQEGAREYLRSEYPNLFTSTTLHVERQPGSPYVENYTYFAIEERTLLP